MNSDTSLASRYGRATRCSAFSHRRVIILTVAALGVLVAFAAYFAFRPSGDPIAPQNVSNKVQSSAVTTVQISVVPDRTRPIRCSVRALNEYEAVVGYREVTVPTDPQASSEKQVHVSVDISTTQRAVQGNLGQCWFVQ